MGALYPTGVDQTTGQARAYTTSDTLGLVGMRSFQVGVDGTSTTTTSTAFTALASMALTPGAGTWLFLFSASLDYSSGTKPICTVEFQKAGVTVGGTESNDMLSDSTDEASISTAYVIALTAGQQVTVDWKVNTGGVECSYRHLSCFQVAA